MGGGAVGGVRRLPHGTCCAGRAIHRNREAGQILPSRMKAREGLVSRGAQLTDGLLKANMRRFVRFRRRAETVVRVTENTEAT